MKKSQAIILILCVAAVMSLLNFTVLSKSSDTVYTNFTGGNNNHTGNGTMEEPYNLFEDALEAVADNGTIYIGDKGAFVNCQYEYEPLIIDKNITIASASSQRASLHTRKSGIVLGADVTFDNIMFSFSNRDRPVICANGYTLNLNNSAYSTNSCDGHIAGGAIYVYADEEQTRAVCVSPPSGDLSRIILSGKNTSFENIYLGSINGSFDKPVTLEINGISGSNIKNIYSCGAKEGYYNKINFLDPYNIPLPPEPDSLKYPLTGTAAVKINQSSPRNIDGVTGSGKNADVIINTGNYYAPSLSGIGSLIINQGIIAPRELNGDVNVFLSNGSMLYMTSIDNKTINNLNSDGGAVVLNANDCLEIKGSITGNTKLVMNGYNQQSNGTAKYDHLYIKTKKSGEFSFIPNDAQKDMSLIKKEDGWYTTPNDNSNPVVILQDFEIENPSMLVTYSQINGLCNEPSAAVKINAVYSDDSEYMDLGMIPFEYTVKIGSDVYGPVSSQLLPDNDWYYEGRIADESKDKCININFLQDLDQIIVSNVSGLVHYDDPPHIDEGVYDITITAYTEKGRISHEIKITVIDDPEGTGGNLCSGVLSVSSENAQLEETADINANITSGGASVSEGSAELYINGMLYSENATLNADGNAVWSNIEMSADNGFTAGKNYLAVVYNGTNKYKPIIFGKELTVKTALLKQEEKPNVEIDYINEKIKGFDINGSYTIGGNDIEISEGGCVDIEDLWYGATILVVKKGGIKTLDSEAERIAILDRPDVPTEIKAVAETVKGAADGKITGVTSNMEYMLSDGEWRDAPDGVITGLSGGDYKVRIKATDKSFASRSVTVNVAGGAEPSATPTIIPSIAPTETPSATPDMTRGELTIRENTNKINVHYKNMSGVSVDNAVVIMAAYGKDGKLLSADAGNIVSAVPGGECNFSYNMTDIEYKTVKIFIWNSLREMLPICCGELTYVGK